MSIRYKIAIPFALLMLAILCIVTLIYLRSSDVAVRNLVVENLEAMAGMQQNRLEELVSQYEEKLQLYNSRVLLRRVIAAYGQHADAEQMKTIETILDASRDSFRNVEDLIFLNREGKVLTSLQRRDRGRDYSSDPLFTHAEKSSFLQMRFEENDPLPRLFMSAPLFYENAFIGVTVVKLTLQPFNVLLRNRLGLGSSGEALLGMQMPSGDLVLFTPLRFTTSPLVLPAIQHDVAVPMRMALEKGQNVLEDARDYRGERVIAVTRFLPYLQVGIVVKKDLSELMAPARQLERFLTEVAVAAVVLSVALSLLISRFMGGQIMHIVETARQISNGNYHRRIGTYSKDELGTLATAVDSMADTLIGVNEALEERVRIKTRMLIKANNELNLIFDVTPNITLITRGHTIVKANRMFLEFTGFPSVEAFRRQYDCICELFIARNGYLQPETGGMNWVEYVIANPDKVHKVAMERNGIENLFIVDAVAFETEEGTSYIAVFENVTELQHIAQTDRLTQVANRIKLDETLSNCQHNHLRYGHLFSIIMVDVDHFKDVNDTHGHLVGDTILREIADLLRRGSRANDVIGRWGGEEFLIVCNDTDGAGTLILAEHLRRKIAAHRFDKAGTVTASFGVAQYREGMEIEELVRRADNALYRAKEGRNRVEADDSALPPEEPPSCPIYPGLS